MPWEYGRIAVNPAHFPCISGVIWQYLDTFFPAPPLGTLPAI